MQEKILQKIKKNRKIWFISIVFSILFISILILQYFETFIYIMLALLDVKELDVVGNMITLGLGWKIVFLTFPAFLLIIGTSYLRSNMEVVGRHIGYKKFLNLVSNEHFYKLKDFPNNDFSISENWFCLDDVLIPFFMVQDIKIRDNGGIYKISIDLIDGNKCIYSPKVESKIVLQMAKLIKNAVEDKKQNATTLFNLVKSSKRNNIINNICFAIGIANLFAFLFLHSIPVIQASQYYLLVNIPIIAFAIIDIITTIVMYKKKYNNRFTNWSIGLSIFVLILDIVYWLCSNYVYMTLGYRY